MSAPCLGTAPSSREIETMSDSYDYIIVGAGAAGCVMAYRLSANPSVRVLLLESGPRNSHPFIHMPKAIGKALSRPNLVWPYLTEANDQNNETPEFWARGNTLGGSTSVNGMMYVRGQPADYDEVARSAGPEWNWEAMGRAFRSIENHELGPDQTRGDKGPLHVSMPEMRNSLTDAMIDAGVAMGLKRKTDTNAPDNDQGIGYAARTVHRGKRESAATAFLDPVRKRPNLVIESGVIVDRLMLDGPRVIGVKGSRSGRPISFRADREVLLAAGALASPAILQRSGVGPADVLHAAGIQIVADRAGVGANLREHRAMVMQWKVRDELSFNAGHSGLRLLGNIARYYLGGRGLLAAATYEIGAWFNTRSGLDRPDGQFLLAPYSFDYAQGALTTESFGGMQICAYYLRPRSTGSVNIKSSDPAILPKIVPNYHSDPEDRAAMIAVARFARRFVRQAPLADKVFEETRPGPDFESDDEIIAAYDRFGNGAYHASGTCRMGLDDDAVLDERLRVRGIDGVRVIDTSILPFLVAGNTAAPAMAMSWRAADLILADANLPIGS